MFMLEENELNELLKRLHIEKLNIYTFLILLSGWSYDGLDMWLMDKQQIVSNDGLCY
jgi:hypothetical protein